MRILPNLWPPLLHSLQRLSSPAQLLHRDDGGDGDDGDNDGSGGCDGRCDDGRDGGTNVTKTNPGKGFGLIIIF